MTRSHTSLSWFSALYLGLLACSSTAYADRVGPTQAPQSGTAIAQTPAESPYEVDLISENGNALDVFQHRGRFYVLGSTGQRYTIRVTNPTAQRVEAVVSVDGLDVIDGKTANLGKRGYVIPAYGELRIDGFRVSTQQVAAFRFSSVSNSYAGRKGQARNVGVIGVAIFAERAVPEAVLVQPAPPPRPYPRKESRPRDFDKRQDFDADDAGIDAPGASAESAPPASAGDSAGGLGSAAPRPSTKSVSKSRAPARSETSRSHRCCDTPKKDRPGLGTEFGERRQSAVSFTQFVRAHATKPTAMAELRYNDAAGLQALGIDINPVDPNELHIRETANPFPDSNFAQPPR